MISVFLSCALDYTNSTHAINTIFVLFVEYRPRGGVRVEVWPATPRLCCVISIVSYVTITTASAVDLYIIIAN